MIEFKEIEELLNDIPLLTKATLQCIRKEEGQWNSTRAPSGKCIGIRFNTDITSANIVEVVVTDWDDLEEEPYVDQVQLDRVGEIEVNAGDNDTVEVLSPQILELVKKLTISN